MNHSGKLQRSRETAALHMRKDIVTAHVDEQVADVLERFERMRDGLFGEYIYIVDFEGRLQGRVLWTKVIGKAAGVRIGDLMDAVPATCHPELDQEQVATRAVRHHVAELPVVDSRGGLLGVVPATAIIGILRREHVEDLHRLAGIRRETKVARSALEAPPGRRARDRLPWLFVGLVGSILATWVMSRFESVLQARLAVAFFIPGLVYLADAIGTQAEAVAIRGLSLSNKPLRILLLEELGSGLFIGLAMTAIVFPAIWLALGDVRLGVTVAGALLAAGMLASTIGLLFPWGLSKAGIDPAFGSGPLATIMQDILSLLVYFGIVRAIMGV